MQSFGSTNDSPSFLLAGRQFGTDCRPSPFLWTFSICHTLAFGYNPGGSTDPGFALEVRVASESSPSPLASELETLKSEIKALKEIIQKMNQRLEQIEDELTALRNMI